MTRIFPPGMAGVLFACLILVFACKKTNSSNNNSGGSGGDLNDTLQPAVTSVGKPAGSPVSKMIGAAGGTLVSSDGVLELTIPAGALAANTNISIQPVTNTMPSGGIGLAYDLLPNGTQFSIPATVTFHYSTTQVDDNDADFLGIAYQDGGGLWQGDNQSRDFDTTARTVSLDVSHFTVYGLFDALGIYATRTSMFSGETILLTPYENLKVNAAGGGTLTNMLPIPAKLVDWKVNGILNGNSAIGTITSQATDFSLVQYQAPPVDQSTIVSISATFKIHVTIYKKKKKIGDYTNFVRRINVTVNPLVYNYSITLAISDSTISHMYGIIPNNVLPVYFDQAKFDLQIKTSPFGLQVVASGIRNQAPTVSPTSSVFGSIKFDWVPDTIGEVDVSSVSLAGGITSISGDSVLVFDVKHHKAMAYGYTFTNLSDGSSSTQQPQPIPGGNGIGVPTEFSIDLKRRSTPYLDSKGSTPGTQIIAAIVPK